MVDKDGRDEWEGMSADEDEDEVDGVAMGSSDASCVVSPSHFEMAV